MMSNVKQLNDDFKQGYWVVLFYAEWCGHCQAMKPEWEQFKAQSQGKKYNVAEVEASQIPDIDEEYKSGVQGFPTIIFIGKGKPKGMHQGERTVKGFDEFANNSIPKGQGKELNINKLLKKHIKKTNKKTNKKTSKKTNKSKSKSKSKKSSKKSKSQKGGKRKGSKKSIRNKLN